jgi:hypothetical protein
MPAPTGPLLGLALGSLFAWAASEGPARGKDAVALGPLALVCLFSLGVFAPTAAYFIAFEPDWSYAYLLDAGRRLGVLHAGVLLADVASVPVGFVLALRSPERAAVTTLIRLAGIPLIAVAVFVIILFPRLSVQATYAQFHGDFGTRAVAGGPLGYALIWTSLVLVGAAAWTAYALRRMR